MDMEPRRKLNGSTVCDHSETCVNEAYVQALQLMQLQKKAKKASFSFSFMRNHCTLHAGHYGGYELTNLVHLMRKNVDNPGQLRKDGFWYDL